MEELLTIDNLISLLSLTLMEIVLGIDNIIFISILTGRLPVEQQGKARTIGIGLALLIRVVLLFAITWLIGLTEPLFTVFELQITIRDLILIAGGLFLLYKSTNEIHEKLEGEDESNKNVVQLTFATAIFQIVLLDMVFSFDSILTAIGLVENVLIMVIAVIISMVIMLVSAKKISDFIHEHPTMKMLALSFLLMIGVLLILDGFHVEVPKGYVYFAIFFSLLVEFLNLKMKKRSKPVELHQKLRNEEKVKV